MTKRELENRVSQMKEAIELMIPYVYELDDSADSLILALNRTHNSIDDAVAHIITKLS